jgi:hypothetical protein
MGLSALAMRIPVLFLLGMMFIGYRLWHSGRLYGAVIETRQIWLKKLLKLTLKYKKSRKS